MGEREPEIHPDQLTIGEVVAQEEAASEASAQLTAPPPAIEARPPRIRKFWLKRFKGFDDFVVEIGDFNVLVGANNAGKSTLLQGLDLLFDLVKLHREGDRLSTSGRLVPASLLPVATIRDLFYRQIWREANEYVHATVGASFADDSSVEFGIRLLFGNGNSQVLASNGIEGGCLESLVAWPAVWVPSAVGIVRDEEYRTPARRAALINAGRHNEILRNLLLALAQEREEEFKRLQEVLSQRFGAQLASVQFDEVLDQFVSSGYEAQDGSSHDLYSAGSGFVQVVQLLAFILLQNASIVLLDEPDAHLHSSLQRVVVEVLDDISREKEMQVLLSTHSKEIINFVDPTRLIFVEGTKGTATPYVSEITPMTILRSLGAIDNVDAYALVKNKRCLFVEGTTDATIFGRFAAKLGNQAFTGDDRVVTVPVGGADRFEHVQQLDVFEAMLGEAIESLEIRDRDGRTDEYRQTAMDRAKRPLLVLELDSIESYLIRPEVVARVVADVSAERGGNETPDAGEIESLVLEKTDELRDNTIDRVAERFAADTFRFTDARVAIKTANEEARVVMDSQWGSLNERLRVVSGKTLLGALRASIQERYTVSFGNERLAEEFEPDEVPSELKDALERIAALVAA
jgi:energy-coupling factor transporter ATP-binding protein EcfA2